MKLSARCQALTVADAVRKDASCRAFQGVRFSLSLRRNILIRMLYVPIVLYLSLVIYAWFFSDRAIFLPQPASYGDGPEILKLRSANGKLISAMYLPQPSAKLTLLVSHGNAEDLGDVRPWLEDLRRAGFNVLAYDYQGYGTSQGKATEKTAYEDEDAAYDHLTLTLKTAPQHIIVFGRSVGTGAAVHLAARRPVAGLILESPFLSAFRVVSRVPILPFDKFPNYKEIRRVHCPVLIVHGTQDEIINIAHGQKLFALANQPKQFFAVEGAGHNDVNDVGGARLLETLQVFAKSLGVERDSVQKGN
jgi:pimeloyl-ACP methyl ester carboxylesterase